MEGGYLSKHQLPEAIIKNITNIHYYVLHKLQQMHIYMLTFELRKITTNSQNGNQLTNGTALVLVKSCRAPYWVADVLAGRSVVRLAAGGRTEVASSRRAHLAWHVVFVDARLQQKHVQASLVLCQWVARHSDKHTYTHVYSRPDTRFTALFWDYPGEPVPERYKKLCYRRRTWWNAVSRNLVYCRNKLNNKSITHRSNRVRGLLLTDL